MAEYLLASGSRKISALTTVSELSGSTSMPIVMGGNTVQISHSNFLSGSLLSKSNIFSGNNTFNGQTTIQTGSVTGNLVVVGRVSAASLTGSLSFNNVTDKPTLVSGSSQITYNGVSNVPSGIVSSSSQIISSLPSGTVSGSSQVSYIGIVNKPNGIVSSSQQVLDYNVFATRSTFNSFTGDGSGLTGIPGVNPIETGSFATTGSNTFIGNQIITGSIEITGSLAVTETITTQILLTPQLLTGLVTVPTGFNGMLTGPVSNGGELTIEGGSNLAII